MRFLILGAVIASFTFACSNDIFESGDGGDDDSSAPADGSADDGHITIDAVSNDAPPLRYCKTLDPTPAFCLDFDDGLTTAFLAGVSSPISAPVVNAGSVVLGTDGLDGGRGADLSIPLSSGGGGGQPLLAEYMTPLPSKGIAFTTGGTGALLHMAFRVDTYAGGDAGTSINLGQQITYFGSISVGDVASAITAGFGIDANSRLFISLSNAAPTTIPIPAGMVWHSFDFSLTLTAQASPTATATLKVDNIPIGTAVGGSPTFSNPLANFNAGLATSPPFPALVARMDNVTFDAK